MECLKCKEEMITAKLIGDLYETQLQLSNKKKGIFKGTKKAP